MSAGNRVLRARRAGVTLVELLVASVILCICLLGAYQASQAALDASRRMGQRAEVDQAAQRTFDVLARDLRAAVVAEGAPRLSFTGAVSENAARMEFYALAGDASAWRPQGLSVLRRVSYSASGGRLVRTQSAQSGPGVGGSAVLADGVAGAVFTFYQGSTPQDSWDSDKALPDAVAVSLTWNGAFYQTLIRLPSGGKKEG